MRWAGHVAHMGEDRGVHRVLVGKSEGKRPLGRPRRRWEDNIKIMHKKPYQRYKEKTNDLLIAIIVYVNDLNKLQQFKVSVQKSHHRHQCTFQLSWQYYV